MQFAFSGLLWLVFGAVLVLLEFVVPGVILVFFGIGAMITSLLVWSGLLQNFSAQLAVFAFLSLGLLFGLRRYAARFFMGKTTKEHDDEYQGKIARVTVDIPPNAPGGKVLFEGTEWKAESTEKIAAGELVRITGRNNITLRVELSGKRGM